MNGYQTCLPYPLRDVPCPTFPNVTSKITFSLLTLHFFPEQHSSLILYMYLLCLTKMHLLGEKRMVMYESSGLSEFCAHNRIIG